MTLRQRIGEHGAEIFDFVRKKWVALTPEEQVRQSFLHFLVEKMHIPVSYLAVEKQIEVNQMVRRYDIVVFNREKKPAVVVECKAPHVKIDQRVVEQVARYNKTLRAPIIGVTNGATHLLFNIDFETEHITFLEDFPDLSLF